MKSARLKILMLLLLFPVLGLAQNPSKWSLESAAKQKSIKGNETFKVSLRADIDPGWHLYALEQPEGGPVATTIKVADGKPFEIAGKIESPKPIVKFDQNFQIDTKFFVNSVKFMVPLKASSDTEMDDLALDARFQLCNDTLCLPPKTIRITFAGSEDVKKSIDVMPSPVAGGEDQTNA